MAPLAAGREPGGRVARFTCVMPIAHVSKHAAWKRCAAALVLVLMVTAAVPWCCLTIHHHGRGLGPGAAEAVAGGGRWASYGAGSTATDRTRSARPHCTWAGSPELGQRWVPLLSSMHLGWVFYPSAPRLMGVPGSVRDPRVLQGWPAPPSAHPTPEIPPPRA